MHSIEQLQALIRTAVAEKKYPAAPAELYEPIGYLMALGGKRMRPVLVLMATDAFGGDLQKALHPAMAIEVFHNFTLMHDDIMDNAPLRRGKATVHEKWNNNIAILSGDVMLVEGYKLLSELDADVLKPALKIFNDTAVGVCEGQQLDMNFETQSGVSIEAYLEMIRLKTAVLLGGALKIGALIAGAKQADIDKLGAFGEQLGIAFQLQDDILDVYGDPEKFGKQVGGDILANKKTYLLIKAQELATGKDADDLNHWIAENNKPTDKVNAVTQIYNSLGIKHLAEQAMQKYVNAALSYLESVELAPERKNVLRNFAAQLIVREQ